ncbi:MAG: alpha-mannosidase [Armatimonadia bacterium]|nr:alpha-mannosidase [Armatimonadia bacterium]
MPYYRDQKRHHLRAARERIAGAMYTPVADLEINAWVTPEPVAYARREEGRHVSLQPGDKWGDLFDCAWFRFTGAVPPEAAGKDVVLLIDVSGEVLVVDEQGNPRRGLTNASSQFDLSLGRPGKRVLPLGSGLAEGDPIEVWADAGCNDLFGELKDDGRVKEAAVAVCHPQVRALYYDFEVLHELMEQLPEDSPRWHRIWAALDKVVLMASEPTEELAAEAREALAPLLQAEGGEPSLKISAVGHAHMDLAWLWPIRETIRKGARTFATALRLMEQYPDYVFGASQPQLYQWMKDHYPTLYDEVKARHREGRWEIQGAMWVESDTNVPSGESLVRQLLYGKRFYRAEFGEDVRNLWLPDVFGYSGSLPQILRKAGVDTFMTQKMSWSIVNDFPHHTFWWEGIDGSRVLAHMLPEETYNSPASPRALAKAARQYRDKDVSGECLLLFGIGDGGGGPGMEHLERLQREKNLGGLPPVVQETAECFFDRLRDGEGYRRWVGELYLERHQGTYTTQGRSKRYNRKLELALRDAEMLLALTAWTGDAEYPRDELEEIWREVLLYQFHDILPGSSITRVYDESLERYAALLERVRELAGEAQSRLVAGLSPGEIDKPVAALNTLSWPRTEWVRDGSTWLKAEVPPMGFAVLDREADCCTAPTPKVTPSVLDNGLLRVELAADGAIKSILDQRHHRQVLQAGEVGNLLAVYFDPGDAWDFPMDYDEREPERLTLESAEAFEDGPVAGIRHVYHYRQDGQLSVLTQELRLTAGSARLDFVTHVDWRASGRMLRTSFPVDVHASEATCDIQFGWLRRPTHENTSWDLARYEVCAHQWVDVSERGYGVALLNDCKYGHQLRGAVLDLNLLRSPHHPDPRADRGEHEFTYSLYPHGGDHIEGQVHREAAQLNVPLRLAEMTKGGEDLGLRGSVFAVDEPNVVIDAIKRAEDGPGMIVRLHETSGARTQAKVSVAIPFESAALVNLMEEDPVPLAVVDGTVSVPFGPHEIQTLRLCPSRGG